MTIEADDAPRGTEALDMLRDRQISGTPDGLFEKTMQKVARPPNARRSPGRFWLGTGFGAGIAASIFALAFVFGLLEAKDELATSFQIALSEPRLMDIAIETDRDLQGATITIVLTGSVDLDGYRGQRELSWTEDLEAGINRLSLPLIATGTTGGQVLVRLAHPHSEQVFIINLETEA